MNYYYSRRVKTEERKNKRKAFVLTILTISSVIVIFFYGLPLVIKFAGFVSDLTTSATPIETEEIGILSPPNLDPLPTYTNQSPIDLRGTSRPGSIVSIFVNDRKVEEVVANNEGMFSFRLNLTSGSNNISAQAKDTAGNESQRSPTQPVIYDTEPPFLEIERPGDGSEFFGSLERQLVISGSTEEGARVQINQRLVVVDSEGKFSFATTLNEGENVFEIKAEDSAGNVEAETLTVYFTL